MRVKLKRDSKLVSRMYFTWFLLGLLYAFFVLILNSFGIRFGFIAFIVIIFGSIQYFMSDKMVLWSSGAKLIERKDDEKLFQIVDEISSLGLEFSSSCFGDSDFGLSDHLLCLTILI